MRLLVSLFLFLIAAPLVAESGYHIRAGDSLRIEVLEDESLNRTLLVTPDGNISFPYAGSLKAAGLTAPQVASALQTAIAPSFALPPTVFVTVSELVRETTRSTAQGSGRGSAEAGMTIYFVGEFEDTGAKSLRPGISFLQALSESGGFTRFAATKRLQLRRRDPSGTEQVVEVNFAALNKGKAGFADFVLQEGDVILAPERRLFE